MSLVELIRVWRKEKASIDEAVVRQRHNGLALQDNLIDALGQAKSHMQLDEASEGFHERAAVRVRILSQHIKRLM